MEAVQDPRARIRSSLIRCTKEWTLLVRISERTQASLTRAGISWSRMSTSEVDRSLLLWDGMVEWGLGSESTALGSEE